MTDKNQLHREHVVGWRHCIRCKLAECRLEERPRQEKYQAAVPIGGTMESCHDFEDISSPIPKSPVVILLSHPDLVQERWANLWGNLQTPKREWPPQVGALLNSFGALQGRVPYTPEHIALVSAFGCRPMNYKDIRKTNPPTAEVIKACTPRWLAEVRMADPYLIIAMGHHAYASVMPRKMTKDDYIKSLGEVLSLTIPGARRPVTYGVYIAPDPNDVAISARRDQWLKPWSQKPPRSETKEPVAALRWHLARGLWLARVLEGGRDRPLTDEEHANWKRINTTMTKAQGSKEDVMSAVKYVAAKVERSSAIELSDQDVRRAMAGQATAPETAEPKTYTFIPEVRVTSRRQRKEASNGPDASDH